MNLEALLRRWRRGQFLAIALRSLGMALAGGSLSWAVLPSGPVAWWVVLAIAGVAAILATWLPRLPMATNRFIASLLDRRIAQLEDSTDLLIDDDRHRTRLEQLQRARIQRLLETADGSQLWPKTQILGSLRFLVAGGLVALLVWVGQARWEDQAGAANWRQAGSQKSAESLDPFRSVEVEIRPPTYTGAPMVRQSTLDIEVFEGSRVRWRVPSNAGRAALEITGQKPISSQRDDSGWLIELTARDSGVYQLVLGRGEGAIRSEYSRVAVIPDGPPRVQILLPLERVTSVSQTRELVDLAVEAEDDHGLKQVELVYTLAQGSGELVEFRQHRQSLRPAPDGADATSETQLDLADMGLTEGSELYLFAEARDNREPESNVGRSGTYIVRFPTERTLSADLDAGLPIVLGPEYFRSQRQIILDTEKLIAEKPELERADFERRSQALGFDQRALRMRYGILLGEEFESGRPVEAGEDPDHEEASDEGVLAGVPADFVHFHDSAEIATYFTSEIRTQLKQVLAQMWDAEGRLRVYQPAEALPFEYAALELLKDLQQRSRIYVQKVGFDTPPLEPEKIRLTGELDDISSQTRTPRQIREDPLSEAASSLLEEVRQGSEGERDLSDEARDLVRSAIADQAGYQPEALLAMTALDRWLAGASLTQDEQQALESSLWQLMPEPILRPHRNRISLDPLSEIYRAALSRGVDP